MTGPDELPRPIPGYFGPSERPLLGWLHPAAPQVAQRDVGVVLCNPFGYEALCAHRSIRRFAEAVAASGYPALRFDYDGTGDSAGDDEDPDRLAGWVGSVARAIDHLKTRTGVERVCLVGLRFGATVAALAAQTREDVAGFAAIAPVVRGKPWLRELRAVQATMGRPEPPPGLALPDGASESVGLLLTGATRAAIAEVDLSTRAHPPSPECLIIDRQDRPGAVEWCDRLRLGGARVRHAVLPGYVEMMLDPHEARVPEAMIDELAGWLHDRLPDASRAARRTALGGTAESASIAEGVQERALFLDDARRLFGILATPTAGRPERALLLLNAGANHHIGNARMYVRFARRLAATGWAVLRYDVSGIGDSAPHPGEAENVVYTPEALADLRTAVEWVLREVGVREVEVAGLCSGAYVAFKGAVAGLPIRGATIVNPLVFYWKEGMSLSYPPYMMVKAAAQYRESVLDPAKWKKLARGRVRLLPILRVLLHRAGDRLHHLGRDVARAVGLRLPEDLGRDLETATGSGTRLRFVFSEGDPGETLLEAGAGRVTNRLLQAGSVALTHLPGCDHSLSSSWMHELLWQELLRALSGG